ncbi:MAG: hypothetical protein JWO87_762 [Phycisphaerales bacterium]|nr:hypothetical protein [Phycisphaerales bacterium]
MNFLTSALDSLYSADYATPVGGPRMVLLILLLAFILGHVVAWVYMWTHAGLSYSRMFAGSLLVLPALVSLFMMLVASNAFIALGMLAVFTMIRFRNVLKDTRDTTFILWSLVEGLGVGTQHFAMALIGGLAIAAIFLYLRFTYFGARHHYDVIVSLEWHEGTDSPEALRAVLRRHSARVQLASQHELEGDRLNISYRLLLRDPARGRELLADLRSMPGVELPTLYHREDESEL